MSQIIKMENATETFKKVKVATAIFEKVTCDEINSMITSSITAMGTLMR
jgi:hypothetical protein